MARIPGSAERARVLALLASLLSRDDEFRDLASDLREQGGKECSDGITEIRDRLLLPTTRWANAYLSELVEHFDGPARIRTLVSHCRPVHEFPLGLGGGLPTLEVDPEASSWWVPIGTTLVNSQWTLWPPVWPVSNLSELENRSTEPRRARRWWAKQELPKGRQPTEILQRDTVLFYLVCWRGLTLQQAAGKIADLAYAGRLHGRSQRGHKKLSDGTRQYHDEVLPGTAVRSAVKRIASLLSDSSSI